MFSALGAFSGTAYGLAKQKSPLAYGSMSGFNTAIASFAFFGSREFAITPLISSARGTPFDGHILATRTDKLVDSGCAGAFTGSILNGMLYGRGRMLSGAAVWALTSALLQLAYNEASLARTNFASEFHRTRTIHEGAPSVPTDAAGFSYSLMSLMTWIAPVKKLSDEEYVELMKKKKDAIDRRVEELSRKGDDSETRGS